MMKARVESDSDIKLRTSMENNDLAGATTCLEQVANPNAKCPDSGLTPLMIACGYGYGELAKRLLERGADPNCADSKGGAFPIHKACQGGHLAIVELLVEHGAMVDCQSAATGHTPLMEAVWFKFADIVEYLLERNARLSIPTHYGFSLTDHLAYELKVNQKPDEQAKLKAIEAAVKNRQDRDQALQESNLLIDAVTKDDLEKVEALLKEGFPVDKRTPCLGNFNDAHTPLLIAVRDGHYAAAEHLLAAGADPNAVEPTFLAVPLHKATYNGRVDMTRLLLAQPGIAIDYQGPTNGYTPLHDALWHGFETCAKLLIDAGADLSLRGHDGKRPIDLAEEVFGNDSELSTYIRERMSNYMK
ncbi:MAG: ankyrin repeat domain-containing protein [Candidatus Thiodiazotropha sp. (ex Dulcina madagascariensis)]|nr:ankyrin repeat domain-containing protein [Candidatus Thiodiazotropha sp. (ex Epidulcina cf. delphinae)]MCU7922834.1 ankyrin repeat domain-containing protein [Candidatus Thiodiazotropha sp. (ex Dulcina madagascariensis)]MCU7925170.1 ankyrin repeat domain-containing protein [Candidatus Thiodiazotropha sp. (ex Dulcina madagascariensis)]